MSNKTLVHRAGALVWVPPDVVWNDIALSKTAIIQTYTVVNISDKPVTIKTVELTPGNDTRIFVSGGTCSEGVVIKPKQTLFVHVSVNPNLLGAISQTLEIRHNGFGFPLRSAISFKVHQLIYPGSTSNDSFLVEETTSMDRNRRLMEQEGHRRVSRVNAREHSESLQANGPENDAQNTILQNPWLNSQRFDGVDPNLNPEPPLNSDAKREFDNERRDQSQEKQLRLGNMPKFSTAPKPQFGA